MFRAKQCERDAELCPTCGRIKKMWKKLAVDEGELEEVEHFTYLCDMIDCKREVEEAVRMRTAAAMVKWKEMVAATWVK